MPHDQYCKEESGMLTETHLAIIAQIVTVSVCLCDLLTRKRMIFAAYGIWLERLETNSRFGWMAYPIGYCSKCTAGQVSLWVFAVRLFLGWEPISLCLIRLIVFCSATILAAEFLSAWLKKMQR